MLWQSRRCSGESFRDKILYINVVNNLSVDCDCDSHPAEPKMKNVGIVASLDPVAIDRLRGYGFQQL